MVFLPILVLVFLVSYLKFKYEKLYGNKNDNKKKVTSEHDYKNFIYN